MILRRLHTTYRADFDVVNWKGCKAGSTNRRTARILHLTSEPSFYVSVATNELQVRLQEIAILSTDPAVFRSRGWNTSFGKPENQWNIANMSLKGATIAIAASLALTALGHALLRLQISPFTCPHAHNLAVRILTLTTGHSYPRKWYCPTEVLGRREPLLDAAAHSNPMPNSNIIDLSF